MESKEAIRLEYEWTMSQTEKLACCVDELKTIRYQMGAMMGELQSGWTGDSARAYIGKCEAYIDALKASDNHLERIADVIRRTAEAYRNAELAAIELAQQ